MEVIQNTPEKFIIRTDMNDTLLNAIRRSIAEIPTLAIEEVEIFKNDSALYDEVLSHRLGLVPLKMEKSFNEKSKIELKLTKVGPGTVYSGDLSGDAEVVFDKIPLTILKEDHKVELVATAVVGKGIKHAKHTPGLCFYRNILEIKSTPEIDKIVSKSKGLIKPEKKGSKWFADLNEAEIHAVELFDEEAITDTPEVIFIVESYGNMPAKEMFTKAISALEDNLDEFEKAF